jgi:epoxyqueuosine reductase QueG
MVTLITFFHKEEIDAFAVVGIDDLPEPDRDDVRQFFPGARSVIVFGKEVPAEVYRLPAPEKTPGMLRIAEHIDATAARLTDRLDKEIIPAKPVPLYLPVRVKNGQVQGVVRLKHIAAAGGLGSIGKCTILLSPRFGPRLLLSGVVSSQGIGDYSPGDRAGCGRGPEEICTGCNRCAQVCPENAIGPEGVDIFRCRTVRAWIPPALVPAVKRLISRTFLQKAVSPLAPHIARMATIRCSLCVTKCPKFSGKEGRT